MGGRVGELARDFVTDEQELSCGYAPRTIQYSLASDTLFVGCKDGTVTVVDGLTGDGAPSTKKPRPTIISALDPKKPDTRLSSVRALAEWCPGWLLVGRDDGQIHLVDWQSVVYGEQEPRFHPVWTDASHRVSYLEWLNQDFLLVSLRNGKTYTVQCDPQGDRAEQDWAADAFRRRKILRRLNNVVCSVPFGEEQRWLQISKDGTAWITREDNGRFSSRERNLWQEVPGFVTDFAIIKPPYDEQDRESTSFDYREQISEGVYISTDNGVYLVSSDQRRLQPQRIVLPGVGRMCLAITYFADPENRYLWVSDSAGDAHLFWSPPGPTNSPSWQRSGIRHDASQVTLGFSSWRKLANRFVVGQARRNNIVISRYRSGPPLPEDADPKSARWLLRYGDAEALRIFARTLEKDADTWEPAAQLAEVFEYLGEAPERTKDLREFLRNPDPKLAWAVLRELKGAKRSREAVELWTYSLLGTVHRYRGAVSEKESLHLGIIRWLRQLSDLKLGDPEQERNVKDAAQEQIVLALKWGVFGTSYTQWRNAAVPSKVLRKQETFDPLDHYAYESFLFQRQAELETEDTRGQMQGRTAWDLRSLRDDQGRHLVAVSWIWGGIELYQVSTNEQGAYHFDLCVTFRPFRESPESPYRLRATNIGEKAERADIPDIRTDLDFGHCRAIILGALPGERKRYYLLASPAQPTGQGSNTRFESWPLGFDEKTNRVRVAEWFAPSSAPLPEAHPDDDDPDRRPDESVYSLLQVEPGLILAGLRGHKGIAQVTALVISGESGELKCLSLTRLTAPSPEGKSIARNSVWALAQEVEEEGTNNPHNVFAGCGDGQVWKLTIPRGWRGESDLSKAASFVNRMGAPVWALACRANRVFAGGADGTILSWQQLKDGRFTSVWATWEGDGPIARIHAFQHGELPMVLALTQQGRAVLFADRAGVEKTDRKPHHKRPRVPGERCGRIQLEASAFASELEALPTDDSDPFLARLISATNDGRLQLHTFRYPLHLPERRVQYAKLVKMWLDMVRDPDSPKLYCSHKLRRAEVAYLASPIAPQVLVRGLLEDPKDSEPFEWREAPPRSKLHRQWVPRYLRPLLDLDRAWSSRRMDKHKIRKSLEEALERAWIWNDRELFVEIVTVILSRSNHWLCNTIRDRGDLQIVAEVYHEILDGLERSLKRWLGSPERAEIRTRITYAKQLTDGDTLWHLGQQPETSMAAKAILRDRLTALQTLLVTGDPLLALETLRASNIAMIRLCRRLVEDGERDAGWNPDDPRQELPWSALDAYVRSVSDFAAGAFHLTQRVNDSLAHEIARAFALTVCCCPSSAIRIGHWLSEADLVSASGRDDRAEEVLKQFQLLESFGVPVPEDAIRALEWACRGNTVLDEVQGGHNKKVLDAVRPFEKIQEWLSRLAKQLSSDASKVDIWESYGHRASLESPSPDDEYSHSRDFWIEALNDFCDRLEKQGLPVTTAREIQPDIVLFSREITAWCEQTIIELNARLRFHKIFQPQHSEYLKTLRQLEDAAREFPKSAAVQTNIVVGILGHGLLEALDEHVLELEEIAQALDPLLVWKHRDEGPQLPPVDGFSKAEGFAKHLIARAEEAESIPKNLRSLQGLLDPEKIEQQGTLKDLLTDFWPECMVTTAAQPLAAPVARELRFLRIIFKELDQNQHKYYGPTMPAGWPRISVRTRILVHFPLRLPKASDDRRISASIEENLETLRYLYRKGLQQLIAPKDARTVASHGTGLYLANLAASVIGWSLKISRVSEKSGLLSFTLRPVYRNLE